jgi:cytochrome c biogenesis protein CcmG, thiol:disulfide interchange protein DsbE
MRIVQATALVAVVGLFSLLVWRLTHQAHPPKIGKQAPSFSLRELSGNGTITLASLRGKPTVINFFASWCPPCKTEAPFLETTWRSYKGRVNFVAIDVNDVTGDALRFVRKHQITFPAVRGQGFSIAERYGVAALPETFVVDRAGHIRAHVAGTLTVTDNKKIFVDGLKTALEK